MRELLHVTLSDQSIKSCVFSCGRYPQFQVSIRDMTSFCRQQDMVVRCRACHNNAYGRNKLKCVPYSKPYQRACLLTFVTFEQFEYSLDKSNLRYTFPMMHWYAERGEMPGSIEVLSQIPYTVKQGCVRPCDALKCIDVPPAGPIYSHGE